MARTESRASRPGRERPRRPSKAGSTKRETSRAARRESARIRRNRTVVVACLALSMAVVGLWFPFSSLLSQHRQLSALNGELARLDQQNALLRQDQRELKQPAEVGRLAQAQYQLVGPGQTAYQVLPPSNGRSGGSYAGDPAYQPLADPSAAASLPGTGTANGGGAPSHSGVTPSRGQPSSSAESSSLWERILHTLEFWQ